MMQRRKFDACYCLGLIPESPGNRTVDQNMSDGFRFRSTNFTICNWLYMLAVQDLPSRKELMKDPPPENFDLRWHFQFPDFLPTATPRTTCCLFVIVSYTRRIKESVGRSDRVQTMFLWFPCPHILPLGPCRCTHDGCSVHRKESLFDDLLIPLTIFSVLQLAS